MNLLEVTGLKKVYTQRLGAKPNVALRNVSFSAAKGEYIAIMKLGMEWSEEKI